MTHSIDSFKTWSHENLTAINDPEAFPINTCTHESHHILRIIIVSWHMTANFN